MIGAGFSPLAAQITAMNEVLRVFASTDFSGPPAVDGPRAAPAAPEVAGAGRGAAAALPPADRPPTADGPRADPSRSLDGLRPPAFAARRLAGGEPPDGPPSRPAAEAAPVGEGDDAPAPADLPRGDRADAADGPGRQSPRAGTVTASDPAWMDGAADAAPAARQPAASGDTPRPSTPAQAGGELSQPIAPGHDEARSSPARPVASLAAGPGPGLSPAAAVPETVAPPKAALLRAATPQTAASRAGADGPPRRIPDPPLPAQAPASAAEAGMSAAEDGSSERARAVAHASPSHPVVLRDAVAGLDLRFASEGASGGAASSDGMGAAVAVATVIFNAAMIPGWPPPRPFDGPGPEAMLARLLARPGSDGDEAALAGNLAARCGAPALGASLQVRLRRLSRARRRRALFGLAALMDTIEAVLEAVEAELLELSRAGRDGEDDWAEAGARRRLTA